MVYPVSFCVLNALKTPPLFPRKRGEGTFEPIYASFIYNKCLASKPLTREQT